MKLLTKFGIVPLLVLFLAVAVHAEPVSQLHPTGYINDFAHVLQPRYIAQMEGICLQVDQKAHAQIALVTINTLDGSDIESYAVNLYKAWGIGGKSSNRGVLILYVIKDRKARIEVGYGLEPILPDGKVGGFQREAIPLMRGGDYNQALMLVTNRIVGVVAQDAGVQISNLLSPNAYRTQARQSAPQHITLGGVVLFVVVLIIVLCTPLRGILFWILLSQIGGGRGGGGGFGGGGGGGGGFGGFGGGSSGGGGSSSNW